MTPTTDDVPTAPAALYTGDGDPRDVELPAAPPWRSFASEVQQERTIVDPDGDHTFVATEDVRQAVDAALVLRRPLLLTGRPGSGKSSLIESVARELRLGAVLRWHVTSRSTLDDALYRYDAIGRLHAKQFADRGGSDGMHTEGDSTVDRIEDFLRLGPLGTALLPTDRPRALLIDEIDKSDIDLPNDLLAIFETGQFEIPELARLKRPTVSIREFAGEERFPITDGKVVCREFPFVVLTSNGERDFPAPFLRRCVRLAMPDPELDLLTRIVERHLGQQVADRAKSEIASFAVRVKEEEALATDQLLNAVFMVAGGPDPSRRPAPGSDEYSALVALLTKELTSDIA